MLIEVTEEELQYLEIAVYNEIGNCVNMVKRAALSELYSKLIKQRDEE
jgi:hypothetical protein